MKKIVKARIELPAPLDLSQLDWLGDPDFGKAKVHAEYDDGSSGVCLTYYSDELSFSESEFIGLSDEEVHQLFHRKDVAYLQR